MISVPELKVNNMGKTMQIPIVHSQDQLYVTSREKEPIDLNYSSTFFQTHPEIMFNLGTTQPIKLTNKISHHNFTPGQPGTHTYVLKHT